MLQGFVKKLVTERGFGFITAQDGVDHFFHRFDTTDFDNLSEGDEVRFEAVENKRGPRAEKVLLLQEAVH